MIMKKRCFFVCLLLLLLFVTGCEYLTTIHEITYSDGISNVYTVKVADGECLEEFDTPVNPGFKFLGWFQENSTEPFDFQTPIKNSFSLDAKWEAIKIKVTFSIENNETVEDIEYNQKVVKPTDPFKDGFEFTGWYLNDELFDFDTNVTTDIVLVAKWHDNSSEQCTITFNNDTEVNTQTINKNEKVEEPSKPIKENFKFLGWYLDNELFDFDTIVTTNIVLVAKWEELIYWTINFNNNGNITTSKVLDGNKVERIDDPTKDGFIFTGWFIEGMDSLFDFTTIITKDITLIAKWEDNTFNCTIKYNLNGGVFNSNDEAMFSKKLEDTRTFTLTKYNEDYWDVWDGNIILVQKDLAPDAIYSSRIGLNKVSNNLFTITMLVKSGTSMSSSDFTTCDYVIVCANNYTQGFEQVNLDSLVVGDLVRLDNIDLENISQGDINATAVICKYSETKDYTLVYNEVKDLLVPTRNNYEFLGWYENDNLFTSLNNKNNQTIELTAKWNCLSDEDMMIADEVNEKYVTIFANKIINDLDLPTTDNQLGCLLKWTSSNTSVVSNEGTVKRTFGKDESLTLSLEVTINDSKYNYDYDVIVKRAYKDISDGGIVGGYNYFTTTPSTQTLKNIDILYCAFGSAGTNGTLTNYSSLKSNISRYINIAHQYGDYVLLCVNTSNLATVAASSQLISVFVNECMKAIKEMDLDGVDIDWETPTTATKTNFTALMKALYTAVKANDPEHLVTAATAGGPWQYPRFDLSNSIKYIDYINLMTYDLHTSSNSSHHNGLYRSTKGFTLGKCTIDESLPYYNNSNVPNEKILIGIPFYGRRFTETNGIGQSCNGSVGAWSYSYLYTTYLTKSNANVTIGFDDEVKVPYIYDAATRTFVSYDDPKSIGIKAEYIKSKGLAGMMYWQDGQDHNNILSNAIAQCKEIMKR